MTENCSPGDADCAIVSWKHNGDTIDIALEDTNTGSGWVGIGFAPTTNMQNSDIYFCQKDGDEVGIVSSFATANTRPMDDDAGTGIITESVGTTVSSDGRFSCSFTRPASIIKQSLTINLKDGEEFYVLIARGPGGKGNPGYHSKRTSTAEAIVFSSSMENTFYGGVPQKDPSIFIKTHASLLFISWGLLAPLG